MSEVLVSGSAHCSAAGCNQLDFLPFTCDACNKVYCKDHCGYIAHACTSAGLDRSVQVILCPVCGDSVRISPSEDPNETWDRHFRQTCSKVPKAQSKQKRCPVQGCKEVLSLSNRFDCSRCGVTVCLRHRAEEDHPCSQKGWASTIKSGAPPREPLPARRPAPPAPRSGSDHVGVAPPSGSGVARRQQQVSEDERLARELQQREFEEAQINGSRGHEGDGDRRKKKSMSARLSGLVPKALKPDTSKLASLKPDTSKLAKYIPKMLKPSQAQKPLIGSGSSSSGGN